MFFICVSWIFKIIFYNYNTLGSGVYILGLYDWLPMKIWIM